MKRSAFYLSVVCLLMLCAGHAFGGIGFDKADAVTRWQFYNGAEFPGARGGICHVADKGHDQPGCLGLDYDFTEGGGYLQATVPMPDGVAVRSVRLMIDKPAAHRLAFRMVDHAGQTFQKGLTYTYADWQAIEVDLTQWESHWGGPDDGQVHWPARSFGILIQNSTSRKTGTLYIDDLQWLTRTSVRPAERDAHYLADDFQQEDRWHPSGGKVNRIEKGRWTYAFHPGQALAVYAGYSFLGRPSLLKLQVQSETAGHRLELQLASHFQNFNKEIGVLKGGEQVFEVPVEKLDHWQRWGGEADGQIRYPLRIARIIMHQGDGPAEGAVELLRLEVETVLPAGRAVLMVPDVRVQDGQPVFSVQVSNTTDTELSGRLICEWRDHCTRTGIEEKEVVMPAMGAGSSRSYTFPAVSPQPITMAVFHWRGPGLRVEPVSIGYGRPPAEGGSRDPDLDSPMGMGVYLYRLSAHRPEFMEEQAALARKMGVKWSREEFTWNRVEPQKGLKDWSLYDRLIDVHHQNGISVFGLLAYWSRFTEPYTEQGIEDYCEQFVRPTVRRFKDRVHCWEVWNEPNIFFWAGPKEMYTKLLIRAYDTIKEEDPQATVLGCVTAGIDIDFINQVIKQGGKFDAVSIHPYRSDLDEGGYIRELQELSELVDGRPIWISEIGFPTQIWGGISESEQAALAVRFYLASMASGVVHTICWYDFRNDGTDPFYNEYNFGVVRNDLRPKPVYRTLATMMNLLAGYTIKDILDIDPGLIAYRFSRGDQDIITVCSPGRERLLTFDSDASIEVFDAAGRPIQAIQRQGHQVLSLGRGFCAYIRGRRNFAFRVEENPVALTTADDHVHTQDEIELAVAPAMPVERWIMPVGMDCPSGGEQGRYRLTISDDGPTGPVCIQAVVRLGDRELVVPLRLHIQPAILRL